VFKKVAVLVVPFAAAAIAVVLAPVSAPADTFYTCPHGVKNHAYCKKHVRCKVPKLHGKTVGQARRALRKHDCKLGKVKHQAEHGDHKVGIGRIYKSEPRRGTIHERGKKVIVFVRKA
jgi:hypothetical protein